MRTVAVGGIQGVPMGYASFPGGQVYAYHKMLSDVEGAILKVIDRSSRVICRLKNFISLPQR